jgi:hypothetical protein
MTDRRIEQRLLCADLVRVQWRDRLGLSQAEVMNLEDISLSGACLQCESHILKGTPVSMNYGNGNLEGKVKYCIYREGGYFLGIEFSEGCKWPTDEFRPKHLLNPETLLEKIRSANDSSK